MCSRQARPLKDALITVEPRDVGPVGSHSDMLTLNQLMGLLFGFCESLFSDRSPRSIDAQLQFDSVSRHRFVSPVVAQLQERSAVRPRCN